MKIGQWLAKRKLLSHDLCNYPGFAGVASYPTCLRCGQPWKDLGIPIDIHASCPGKDYKKQMRAATEKLWQERML